MTRTPITPAGDEDYDGPRTTPQMLEAAVAWQARDFAKLRGLGLHHIPAGFVITMPSETDRGLEHASVLGLWPVPAGVAVEYRGDTITTLPSMVAALAFAERAIKAEDAKRPRVFLPRKPRGPNKPVSPWEASQRREWKLLRSVTGSSARAIKFRQPRKPKA